MGRLIDAEKLKQHYAWWEGGSQDMTLDRAKQIFDTIIDVQPTVDAEPVRHGRWIYLYDGNYKCSECGSWWTCEGIPTESGMLYCPNCGAKMDESKEQSKGETKERREDG